MPKAFIPHSPKTGTTLEEWSALLGGRYDPVICSHHQPRESQAEAFQDISEAMLAFEEGDAVVAAGDPIAIGFTMYLAAVAFNGLFTVLRWSRHPDCYVAVEVDFND